MKWAKLNNEVSESVFIVKQVCLDQDKAQADVGWWVHLIL